MEIVGRFLDKEILKIFIKNLVRLIYSFITKLICFLPVGYYSLRFIWNLLYAVFNEPKDHVYRFI